MKFFPTIISSFILTCTGAVFDDATPDSTLLNDASLQVANANMRSWKAVDVRGDWMVSSGYRAGVWKYNSATSKYDDFQAVLSSEASGVCKVARSSDHIVCSDAGSDNAYRYKYNSGWAWYTRNKLAGDDSYCVAGHPCDNVAITDDGNFVLIGWAATQIGSITAGQGGFVRLFDCRYASNTGNCNAKQWANSDGTFTGNPYHGGRGKNFKSAHGMSIDIVEDPYTPDSSWFLKHLVVSGAPGDTDGIGAGLENPDVSREGADMVGGYVQISIASQDNGAGGSSAGIRPITRHWAPAEYDHAGNRFGAIVRISRDGMRMVVTAPGQHSDGTLNEVGAFYVYSNNGDNTFTLEAGPYFGPAQDEDFGWSLDIDDSGDRIFIGAPRARSGDGTVYVYHKSGAGQWSPQGDTAGDPSRAETDCGEGIAWDGPRGELLVGCPGFDNVVTNEGLMLAYNLPDAPTVSPTASPTVPPACFVSSDCASVDEYCSSDGSCESTPCLDGDGNVDHTICDGFFQTGRLPLCHKVGYCRDTQASTCATPKQCTQARTKYLSDSNSVGKVSVSFGSNLTPAKSRQAALTQITQAKANSETSAELKAFVTSSKEITLDGAYFEAVGSQSAGLGAIKDTVCGTENVDLCSVVISSQTGGRRVLNTEYTVTVTYEVDDATFASIENNTSIDDPAFLQELASSAGIDVANVTITATGGELTVTYVLVAESGTGEPLGDDVLQDIEDLETNLDNVTQSVISTLNITASDIESTTLDKCDGRDCNGFGTDLCDSDTGQCNCPAGYWGINCDEVCTCENGGTCPVNMCHCPYPYFGAKCNSTKTECSDGNCV